MGLCAGLSGLRRPARVRSALWCPCGLCSAPQSPARGRCGLCGPCGALQSRCGRCGALGLAGDDDYLCVGVVVAFAEPCETDRF